MGVTAAEWAAVAPAWAAWQADDNLRAISLVGVHRDGAGRLARLARLIEARALRDAGRFREARALLEALAAGRDRVAAAAHRSRALLRYRTGAADAGDRELALAWEKGGAARDIRCAARTAGLLVERPLGAPLSAAAARVLRAAGRVYSRALRSRGLGDAAAGRDVGALLVALTWMDGRTQPQRAWRRVDRWLCEGWWHPQGEGAVALAVDLLIRAEAASAVSPRLVAWAQRIPRAARALRALLRLADGWVAAATGDIGAAQRALGRSRALGRLTGWAATSAGFMRACVLFELGRLEEAERLLLSLDGAAPPGRVIAQQIHYRRLLAALRACSGGLEEHLARLRSVVGVHDDPSLRAELGRLAALVALREGDFEGGVRAMCAAREAAHALGCARTALLCDALLAPLGPWLEAEELASLRGRLEAALRVAHDPVLASALRGAALDLLAAEDDLVLVDTPAGRPPNPLADAWARSARAAPDLDRPLQEWSWLLESGPVGALGAAQRAVHQLVARGQLAEAHALTEVLVPEMVAAGQARGAARMAAAAAVRLARGRAAHLRPLSRWRHGAEWASMRGAVERAWCGAGEPSAALGAVLDHASLRAAELGALAALPERRRALALRALDGAPLLVDRIEAALRRPGAPAGAPWDRPRMRRLAAGLRPGERVAVGTVVGDDLHLYWFGAGARVGFARLPGAAGPLEAMLAQLRSARDGHDAPRATRALGALGGLVADALRAALRGVRTVYWLPDGLWSSLPLSALPDPASPARPLARRAGVVFLPGLDVLERPCPADVVGPMASWVDPAGDLPGARREAAALQSSFPVLELRCGAAASVDALLSMPPLGLLHIAAHGTLDPGHPLLSPLQLAPAGSAGALRPLALLLRRSAPRIALLHGCNTGGAVSSEGAEAVDLPSVWLAAGAEAVVGCEGPLLDAVSGAFTAALVAALGEGEPVGAAFRAGIAAVSHRPAAAWCGLRLWGDPRVRVRPAAGEAQGT